MDSSGSIKTLRSVLDRRIFVEDDLDQYERYIVQIESNKTNEPNIAIEAVKALAEAVFRHILAHGKIKVEFAEILTQSKPTTYKIFQSTCKALADQNLIDIEILGLGQKFFNDISEIRNSVGLISHGKDLRDVSNLSPATLELAISTTLNYIVVILEAYEQLLEEPKVSYEDNTEFNEYLDEQYPVEGILYSQALFDQDAVSYEEQLDEYNSFKEEAL